MRDWKTLSYQNHSEPLMGQLSYAESQRLYNMFCERLTYSRSRCAPLRRKISIEEKSRAMVTLFGESVANAEDVGDEMYQGINPEYVASYHEGKRWYLELRKKAKVLKKSLAHTGWKQANLLSIAREYGAEIAGLAKYYDPVYKNEMVSLVFGIGILEVNKMRVPSLDFLNLGFKNTCEIQNATNAIVEKLWQSDVYCEPVPCATSYHIDNLEFNEVRFCEAAFSGRIGKNFLFVTEEFGPKFRMGQVILYAQPNMTLPQPEFIDFCKDCTVCVDACPSKALKVDDVLICTKYCMPHDGCSICLDVCPIGKD